MQRDSRFPWRSQIVDLPVRGCQFHRGVKDERGFLVFCGQPVKPGSSYCPEHHRKVYQRVAPLRSPHVATEVAAEPSDIAVPEVDREAA
jgi:hypothetical protein